MYRQPDSATRTRVNTMPSQRRPNDGGAGLSLRNVPDFSPKTAHLQQRPASTTLISIGFERVPRTEPSPIKAIKVPALLGLIASALNLEQATVLTVTQGLLHIQGPVRHRERHKHHPAASGVDGGRHHTACAVPPHGQLVMPCKISRALDGLAQLGRMRSLACRVSSLSRGGDARGSKAWSGATLQSPKSGATSPEWATKARARASSRTAINDLRACIDPSPIGCALRRKRGGHVPCHGSPSCIEHCPDTRTSTAWPCACPSRSQTDINMIV